MKTLPIATLLLMLPACSIPAYASLQQHRSFDVIWDENIPDAQPDRIRQAIQEWSGCGIALAGNVGHCDTADPGPGRICIRQEPLAQIESEYYADTLDYTTVIFPGLGPSGADIAINPDASVAQIAHEMGHGMGLGHTQPGTIMCKDTNCAADHVTEEDCANWAASRE